MTVRLPESLAPVPDAAERFAWAEQEERTVEGAASLRRGSVRHML